MNASTLLRMLLLSAGLGSIPGLSLSSLSAAEDAPPKRYAILVGVENYEHAKLREPNPLKYPVDDVSALAEILEKADYEVLLLTDDTGKKSPELLPTRSNIEVQIKQVVEKCRRQDTILIALTGHGLQFTGNKDAYFCPIDARPFASETKTLVSVSGIYEELEKSFAGVKVILVDACRNDPDPGRGRGLDADSAPPPPKGVAALFSCSAGQRAFEHDEYQHGIFFHHVLEGMNGKAADQEGEVTFDSLSAYVRRAVPKSMQRLLPGQEQFPNLKADLVGVPPVLATINVAKISKPSIPPAPEKPKMEKPNTPTGKAPELLTAPFSATAAAASQKAWAKHLNLDVEIENSIGMKLTLIPPAEFKMGSEKDGAQADEKPVHTVRLTKPFYLGTHEVTRGEFRKFVTDEGYRTEAETDGKGGWGFDGKELKQDPDYTWKTPGFDQTDDHPVVHVSWNDAVKYCEWLSRQEGVTYRLPTEAEWEYASRAGTQGTYVTGDDPEELAEVGNVADGTARKKFADWTLTISAEDGYVFTAPVGSFRKNPFGLRDMHGNVWEWCSDWYDEKYYTNSRRENPEGASSGSNRVFRGGAWSRNPANCRSAFRNRFTPSRRNDYLGFRVARVP